MTQTAPIKGQDSKQDALLIRSASWKRTQAVYRGLILCL